MGWMGLVIPEQYGGAGATFLDLTVLLEEMGRACLPGPFFSTIVLGGMSILEAGNDLQKREFLPRIAAGKLILTLALAEPHTGYSAESIHTEAIDEGNSFIISGTKFFVPDAHVADNIICVAKSSGQITLFLVDAKNSSISKTLLKTIAGDKQCEAVFNKLRTPKASILGKEGQGNSYLRQILLRAAVAKSAEMVGASQRVLEMTVDYVKQRVQFGQPVGAFQAVQHHCANMMTYVDTSKYLTYKAAWMLSEGLFCTKEVAMAKAWTSDAYRKVTLLGHQCIGGVGYMEDHDLPLYSKRAKADEIAFGDADFHRDIIAQELLV